MSEGTMRALRGIALASMLSLLSLVMLPSVRALTPGDDAFERTWSRTDQPVASGAVGRTWMWGPEAFSSPMMEWMSDAPNHARLVQYFDKSRMEITIDPDVNPGSVWYVTNGLLASELIRGQLQLGLDEFEQRQPAEINVAGDADDLTGPTYASFTNLLTMPPATEGQLLTARVDRNGVISDGPNLATREVHAATLVPETNHRVARPFWDFMNASGPVLEDNQQVASSLFQNPFFATGFPISEAYWASVQVNGQPKDVLIQVFQRRVLTYTPDNEPGWQVEAGNVGRHYYAWRYGIAAPDEPPALEINADPIGPTPLPAIMEGDNDASITVANGGPTPLTITFRGSTDQKVELAACTECQITAEPPSSCSASAPSATVQLPPGAYTVVAERSAYDSPPLGGPWTFVPGAKYGACFFIVDS